MLVQEKKCELCGMGKSRCYCEEQTTDRESMASRFKDICFVHGMSEKETEELIVLASHMLTR